MKYGDYWLSEIIPEWKDYYINYIFLKKILKELKLFKNKVNLKVGDKYITTLTEKES